MRTHRLRLEPVSLCDADEIQALVSDRAIAATTLHIPHPYPEGGAREYIQSQMHRASNGEAVAFVARQINGNTLVGAIALTINQEHARAEMGYWVGVPFWGQGFASEGAAAVLHYAFHALDLNRVFAHHMLSNAASGQVLLKNGMQREATLQRHILKWGTAHDVAIYGITRSQYDAASRT